MNQKHEGKSFTRKKFFLFMLVVAMLLGGCLFVNYLISSNTSTDGYSIGFTIDLHNDTDVFALRDCFNSSGWETDESVADNIFFEFIFSSVLYNDTYEPIWFGGIVGHDVNDYYLVAQVVFAEGLARTEREVQQMRPYVEEALAYMEAFIIDGGFIVDQSEIWQHLHVIYGYDGTV